MSSSKASKIKPLLDAWQPHTVATSEWLGARGINPQDVRNYLGSKWLVSLGRGAFKRPSETVTWQGALYSIQKQSGLPVHVGALTALEMTGHQHYVRFGRSEAYLFSAPDIQLPKWFRAHWGADVRHVRTKLFPAQMAMTTKESPEGLPLVCSSPEQAILETLHLAPKEFDLVEVAQIIEGMTSLRPKVMQELLEACASIKVKRLFLYLAERAGLSLVQHLDLNRIDLGTGKRAITETGRLTPKYGLLLPEELVTDGD
jgi:Transcriptional regulator, AbiEi antitoxin, Type IV TA system/Transcriptional regulator, AbiEi antitoxin N-terminal domain